MTRDTTGDVDHPAAQIPLSGDLIEKLGDSATDYAAGLWSVAQQRDADAGEMATLIGQVNDRFGIDFPGTVVQKWQEIFRNAGGLVTIISEDRVLAGGPVGDNAMEPPYASDGPDRDQQTDSPSS
ncbi:MAG TPA: hypothetical protein VG502_05710 [Flexivirga sp.]|uniref:hypothetical protein n=1 Tax=Flexivirga sp. TaxID=1962927 RepID=UPI002B72E93F|nr:hypothetical protein [Flexivirga sp.]HWC21776.1 hypothetical protein [Flexivirga sp.]